MKNYLFDQNVGHCGDIVFEKNIVGGVKGCTPGEWVCLTRQKQGAKFLAFVNPFRQDGRVARIIAPWQDNVESYLEVKISTAIELREALLKDQGARLFFGSSDGIPGLVIDRFENVIVVQYHLLGAQAQREKILSLIKDKFPQIQVSESTRPEAGEEMIHLNENFPPKIQIVEQGITYEIARERFQKTGFYYDHRSNRKKLFEFFSGRDLQPKKVLDLYSYLGSWGAPFHRYLGSQVSFFDQADLSGEFNHFFNTYGNDQASAFIRSNVQSFLSEAGELDFDLVICDPPAFKKGQDKKREALQGYEAVIKKIVPRLVPGTYFALSSCTHGVSHEELDQCVNRVALKQQRKMQLLDIGLQDVDHPMTALNDKSMYIKYLLYLCKE